MKALLAILTIKAFPYSTIARWEMVSGIVILFAISFIVAIIVESFVEDRRKDIHKRYSKRNVLVVSFAITLLAISSVSDFWHTMGIIMEKRDMGMTEQVTECIEKEKTFRNSQIYKEQIDEIPYGDEDIREMDTLSSEIYLRFRSLISGEGIVLFPNTAAIIGCFPKETSFRATTDLLSTTTLGPNAGSSLGTEKPDPTTDWQSKFSVESDEFEIDLLKELRDTPSSKLD